MLEVGSLLNWVGHNRHFDVREMNTFQTGPYVVAYNLASGKTIRIFHHVGHLHIRLEFGWNATLSIENTVVLLGYTTKSINR